jgi:hypothetical protein
VSTTASNFGSRPPAVSLVSAGGTRSVPTVNSFRNRNQIEVEWMRSDGMVRMIPDNRSGVPIIWVKRQPPLLLKRRNAENQRRVEPRYSTEGYVGAEQTPMPTVSLSQR